MNSNCPSGDKFSRMDKSRSEYDSFKINNINHFLEELVELEPAKFWGEKVLIFGISTRSLIKRFFALDEQSRLIIST